MHQVVGCQVGRTKKSFFFQSTIHAHYSTKVAPAGDSSSSPLFDDHHRVPNYHLPFDPWIQLTSNHGRFATRFRIDRKNLVKIHNSSFVCLAQWGQNHFQFIRTFLTPIISEIYVEKLSILNQITNADQAEIHCIKCAREGSVSEV